MQKKKAYEFKAKILASKIGKGGAYIEFPYDVEKEFGTKGRVKVRCFFNNAEYRGSLVKMGTECHIIGITKEIRKSIGKDIGDMINVKILKDEEERIIEIPGILEKILRKDKKLFEAYNKLSYTNKKEIYGQLTGAKKPETANSRLHKILSELSKSK
jgi:hypothetical protein